MVNRKEVIDGLLQNIHAMRHKMMVGYAAKKEMPITPSQGCVLRFVQEHSSANVKAIAQALHITSSAATQLIDGLVDKDYLIRKEGLTDRRVSSLSLSKKAQKLFKEFHAQTLEKMTELFTVLTDEELVQYAYLNQKIAHNLSHKI